MKAVISFSGEMAEIRGISLRKQEITTANALKYLLLIKLKAQSPKPKLFFKRLS
jgi:hypothetical protein